MMRKVIKIDDRIKLKKSFNPFRVSVDYHRVDFKSMVSLLSI